ncbi:MAG TPA: Gfo/Idh/MocA family oxidoreductase [Thermomicrobiales bacterium]|nr:Gfo/Idh/MocA family oxidoreductase [Thermomicrobiales bacterium]
MIRLVQLGIDHPHAAAYRQTLALFPDRIQVVGFLAHEDDATVIGAPFEDVPVFHSLDDLLDGVRFDAAQVMLREHEAGDAMLRLAQEGIHLWAEKPVARRAADLLPVAEAISARSLVFTAGYQSRFYPTTRFAQGLVRDGLLGPLTFAQMTTTTTTATLRHPDGPLGYLFDPAISGGGVLHWLGCHMVDLLLAILGETPATIAAVTAQNGETETPVEDVAAVTLTFPDGSVASLAYGYLLPTGESSPFGDDAPESAIHGHRGWVRWSSSANDARAFSTDPRWRESPWQRRAFANPATGGYGHAAWCAMTNFLDAIAGLAAPEYTIEQAIAVLSIIEAAYSAASQRRTIDLALSPALATAYTPGASA